MIERQLEIQSLDYFVSFIRAHAVEVYKPVSEQKKMI